MPRTQARANEITVTQTSSQAPTRNACLFWRTMSQLNVYASSATACRRLRRGPDARTAAEILYVWYGTATPLVPTTDVFRWNFLADGPTHCFQRPAIVWWVDW